MAESTLPPTWWSHRRRFSLAELIADGIVHGVGLMMTAALGAVLIAFAAFQTAPEQWPALTLYVSTLLMVLGISLAFNLCPIDARAKKTLARLDQAAIFLFIAGSYTPFLTLIGPSPWTVGLGTAVWISALIGVALKLIVPHRFGRGAIALYLAIGWSGVVMLNMLATLLSPLALGLLIAGGVSYSVGVIFLLWHRLDFHNAVWHGFVVAGASLHMLALLDTLVLSRL